MWQDVSIGGESLQSKLLFWIAVAMAVAGMLSPEGNLYFFLAVHTCMLMIGCSLQRREKRGRRPAPVKTAPSKSPAIPSKAGAV
jgi:hypothetical protein